MHGRMHITVVLVPILLFAHWREVVLLQEWWTYVCMGPSDPHPNWHLGMQGTQHRAVMWRVWKEGGTGFLYWGANCYEKATAARAEIRFRHGLPPGDGVLYYPGEDIEYLRLYASRYGKDEGIALLERTGVYFGPERYTFGPDERSFVHC